MFWAILAAGAIIGARRNNLLLGLFVGALAAFFLEVILWSS